MSCSASLRHLRPGTSLHFSTIKPVKIMLTHECNQLLRVVRGGGVTGLMDLAGERVWIILEFEGGSIAPVRPGPDPAGVGPRRRIAQQGTALLVCALSNA